MSKFKIRSTAVLAIAVCLSAASFAQNHPFISFDAPDGANGTIPTKINANGQIVGGYSDSHSLGHSFVRSVSGQITEFDPPNLTDSEALDINSRGQIVGVGGNGNHAYLRLANGIFHEIDPPGAVSALPSGINDFGTITGHYYSEASGVGHGFVLNTSGTYTLFDAPDAGTLSGSGTFPTGVNASGKIVGFYRDNNGVYHAFVRDDSGAITEFDPPGTLNGGSWPRINSNGDVVGSYFTDGFKEEHGFLRDATGVITTIDCPGSSGTNVNSINDNGAMVGTTFSSGGRAQGFRRSASGICTTLVGPLSSDIVYPSSLNNRQVTGRYQDAAGISHGFVQ